MRIVVDELTGSEVLTLLGEHLDDMYATSPIESVHALDVDELRKPDVTFWSVWIEDALAGCGALKELDPVHGEIKSMRTAAAFRRQGVATQMLDHVIGAARAREYERLSLETGPQQYFSSARRLYQRHGFVSCPPFGGYTEDPYSVFMTLSLRATGESIHPPATQFPLTR